MAETGARRQTWFGTHTQVTRDSGQGMLVRMDLRPGRTQAHMFLEDAGGSITAAARVEKKQDGRGDAGTLGKVGPRIPRNSDGTMAQKR